jgi:hypothetical protein
MTIQTASLQSSFTLVPDTMVKPGSKGVIGMDVFSSEDQHIILHDAELAESMREFALREMQTIKIPVGDKTSAEAVEFFWLGVTKAKMAKISTLLSQRWHWVVLRVTLAREEAGNMLAPEVTPALAAVENLIAIRRFLANGMLKTKRVLLFHHTMTNSPDVRQIGGPWPLNE